MPLKPPPGHPGKAAIAYFQRLALHKVAPKFFKKPNLSIKPKAKSAGHIFYETVKALANHPNPPELLRFKENSSTMVRRKPTRKTYLQRRFRRAIARHKSRRDSGARRRRKNFGGKKRLKFGKTQRVAHFGLGIPWRLRVKLVDAQTKTLATNGTTIVASDDPLFNVFTRQPMYWDQLSPLYKEYTISGVMLSCRFWMRQHQAAPTKVSTAVPGATDWVNQPTYSPSFVYVRIKEDNTITNITDYNEAVAKPYTIVRKGIYFNKGRTVTIKKYIPAKALSHKAWNMADYTAAVGADPSVNTAYEIGTAELLTDTVSQNMFVTVERTFYLTFRQIANQGPS